jgi:hypothetical protein
MPNTNTLPHDLKLQLKAEDLELRNRIQVIVDVPTVAVEGVNVCASNMIPHGVTRNRWLSDASFKDKLNSTITILLNNYNSHK